jgi:hypothetical protein
MGHEAACVRLFSKDGADFPGVLQIGESALSDPSFWARQACDLVVANTWGSPRYSPMLRAIKSSGSAIMIRMDSDGYNSPWNGLGRYISGSFHIFRERSAALIAMTKALAKGILYSIPLVYDQRMLDHLTLADAIGIESEGAYFLFARLLRSYRRDDLVEKLHVIRHPVVPEILNMNVPTALARRNRIIAVGRWDSHQKDTPLLVKSLRKVLASRSDWEVHLYGAGDFVIRSLMRGFPERVQDRMHLHGPQPHDEILRAYGVAKICLFTSYYEGSPIAGAEALSLGCSLVGPPDVPSMRDLCAPHFGTLAHSRRSDDMSAALGSEIQLWEAGKRQPDLIASDARRIFAATSVCQKILAVFADRASRLQAGSVANLCSLHR